MVYTIVLCPVTGTVVCILTPHTACRSAAPMAGQVTHVNYTLFPTALRILDSHTPLFFYNVNFDSLVKEITDIML